MIALSVVGSATLLFSCGKNTTTTVYDYETLMTESSENRTIIMMDNGKRSYTFTSPLMEGYSLATNPYQEFRRGIEMVTFTDSLSLIDATITANYAIYYERQKLWEAKGNVVIIKRNRQEGDTTVTGLTEIYTQQLFWNATTKKIYSNVDTKVLQPDGWHFGVGFDADDDLKNIHFRKYSSEVEFDMSQPEPKSDDNDNRDGDGGSSAKESKSGSGAKADNKAPNSKSGSGAKADKKAPNSKSSSATSRSKSSTGTVKGSSSPSPTTRPTTPTTPTTPARATRPNIESGVNSNQKPSSVPSMGDRRQMGEQPIKSGLELSNSTLLNAEVTTPQSTLGSKSEVKSDTRP